MELEGRLNPAMSLPEVLQFLSMGKMTGTLTVTQGNYSAALMIRQGRLINSCNLGRPRRLGQMLINRGFLPRSAVEDALVFQKHNAPQTPLGQILIQRGNVTTEQVRQALRLQLEEELWDLFGVQDGTFKFENGDERAVAGDSLVELEIDPLLLEGTRRLDEWARIVKNIPQGEGAVPTVTGDEEHLDREMMTFSDSEWRVLSLVNGYYDIGSISGRSGIGKFETFRVINSFLASGHIVIDQQASNGRERANGPQGPGEGIAFNAHNNGSEPDGHDLDEEMDVPLTSSMAFPGGAATTAAPRTGRSTEMQEALPMTSGALASLSGGKQFRSPVGFSASLASMLLAHLLSLPDFSVGPDDERLAEQHWRNILMGFPKADIIQAYGKALDASQFERFVEFAGIDGPVRPIYEDAMEALARYLRTLYLISGQRLGIKTAQSVIPKFIEQFRQGTTIENEDSFYFQDFAGKIYS